MIRLVVYDRFGGFVKELAPADVFAATRSAQINGEDALDISTSDYLAKGQRVVYRDGMGRWHEYIVSGGDEAHDSGRSAVGTYHCENSWAELRTAPYIIDKRPGSQGAVSAQSALATALEGTRWEVGECDLVKTARTTWYHVSPWDAVADLVNVWGGQLRADIEVDGSGVVNRKLSLMQSIGLGPGVRFDYGADVSGITVTHDESDIYTALYCYGKGVETESGGYGRKIGIEEVNGGVPYVEDAEAKQIWGQIGPDGLDNAYGIYENGDCEDASQLKAEGIAALADASRPKVQYSATVVQFSRAGLDLRGATLGDRADIVDRSFYRSRGVDSDLRLSGVVVGVVENLLDPASTSFTLGDIMGTIAQTLAGLSSGVGKLEAAAPTWNDAATNSTSYVNDLIDRLNQEINATGGYTYVKQGQGIWVYDKAEDQNPTKVINLMGGSMRIADSKTASGDWDWRSVFVSGHIAADLVTAASLVAGYIGSPDGGNYWNLDTGELRIASDTTIGGKQIATADAVIESVDVEYASGTSSTTAPTSGWSTTAPAWQAGRYIWQRTKTVNQDGTASYSQPTCIQGAEGEAGIGVSGIVEQYYLSTSQTAPAGGSWSTAQPEWAEGRYIWTRSEVTWTDGSATHTDPVLAKAINGANQSASDAAKVATNYAEFVPGEGLVVGDMTAGTLGGNTLIKAEGMDIRDGQDALATFRKDSVSLGSSGQGSQVSLCGELVVDVTVGSDGRTFARIRGNGESGVTVTGPGDLPAMMSFFGLDGGSEPSGRQFGTVMAYAHTISVNKQVSGGVAGGIYTLSDHMVYLDLVDVTALDSAFRPRMAMRGGFVQLQGRVVPSKKDAVVCDLSEYAWSLDIPPEGVNRNFICFGLLNGENFPVNVYLNHQGQILISNKPDFVDLSGVVVRNNGNLAGDYME